MQQIDRTLRVDAIPCVWCDARNAREDTPAFLAGTAVQLNLDLRDAPDNDSGTLPPYAFSRLSPVVSWYLAIDTDFDRSTTPKLIVSTGISAAQDADGRTVLTANLPVTDGTGILSALGTSASLSVRCEIGGYDADADLVFCIRFDLAIRNRAYFPDATPDTPGSDPEYLTNAQVRALVNAGLALQYSADGESWHDAQAATDTYLRVRFASDASGTWSGPARLPSGFDVTGATAGQFLSFNGTTVAWTDPVSVAAGPGIAVNGSTVAVDVTGATNGQVVMLVGGTFSWQNLPAPIDGLAAGQGVAFAGSTIGLNTTTATAGQFLSFNGTTVAWANPVAAGPGITVSGNTVAIDVTGAASGQVLMVSGGTPAWGNPPGGSSATVAAGAGIDVVNSTVSINTFGATAGQVLVRTANGVGWSTLTEQGAIAAGPGITVADGTVSINTAGAANGQVLTLSGGTPAWTSLPAASVTVAAGMGIAVSGATVSIDVTGATSGQYLKYNGTTTVWDKPADSGQAWSNFIMNLRHMFDGLIGILDDQGRPVYEYTDERITLFLDQGSSGIYQRIPMTLSGGSGTSRVWVETGKSIDADPSDEAFYVIYRDASITDVSDPHRGIYTGSGSRISGWAVMRESWEHPFAVCTDSDPFTGVWHYDYASHGAYEFYEVHAVFMQKELKMISYS